MLIVLGKKVNVGMGLGVVGKKEYTMFHSCSVFVSCARVVRLAWEKCRTLPLCRQDGKWGLHPDLAYFL